MDPILIAVFLVLVVAVQAGAFVSLSVQRSIRVIDPAGRTINVRLTATGVGWVPLVNARASWTRATFWWIRYLRNSRRTWSITATPLRGESTVVGEFATRSVALTQLRELASQVAQGEVVVP